MLENNEIIRKCGNRIKEIRQQNNMTQAQLAEKTELSVPYISHIENGRKYASFMTIIKIAENLGITVDQLLYGVQTNYKFDYESDIDLIMYDCTPSEKEKIFKTIMFIKKLIRE